MRLELIVKVLMNYMSDIIGGIIPDDPDEKQTREYQKAAICAHSLAKTYGVDVAKSTETELDDKAVAEIIESCEDLAEKHQFSLDSTQFE